MGGECGRGSTHVERDSGSVVAFHETHVGLSEEVVGRVVDGDGDEGVGDVSVAVDVDM